MVLMVVLMVLGFAAYFQLGQDEDPPFTFRLMVVRTFWPGATAQQMAEQVTDKIERTLQEVPNADKIRSYSKPGESQIIMELKDYSKPSEVANVWYTVRKEIPGIKRDASLNSESAVGCVQLSYINRNNNWRCGVTLRPVARNATVSSSGERMERA